MNDLIPIFSLACLENFSLIATFVKLKKITDINKFLFVLITLNIINDFCMFLIVKIFHKYFKKILNNQKIYIKFQESIHKYVVIMALLYRFLFGFRIITLFILNEKKSTTYFFFINILSALIWLVIIKLGLFLFLSDFGILSSIIRFGMYLSYALFFFLCYKIVN